MKNKNITGAVVRKLPCAESGFFTLYYLENGTWAIESGDTVISKFQESRHLKYALERFYGTIAAV